LSCFSFIFSANKKNIMEAVMKRSLFILLVSLFTIISMVGCNQINTLPNTSPDISTDTSGNSPAPSQERPTQTVQGTTPETLRQPGPDEPTGKSLSIVSTIFPQYDWVLQILGDRAGFKDLTLLINNRIDLHNYQPAVSDIAKISTCDLFIYVGGESDEWVEAVLGQAINRDMVVINLLELLGDSALNDEPLEDGSSHSHHHHHHHHADDEDEYDEHVWLSLKNAIVFCTAISDALSSLDPELSEVYEANLAAYIERLSALDKDYVLAVTEANGNTLLFADRFPFRYMLCDYGLNYYAAFPGCSAETEASFQTVVFLARKIDELGLVSVMVTESADQSIAGTIIRSSRARNQQILVLDSMQSSNTEDWQRGVTYLSVMESNLRVLKEALNYR